MVMHARKIPRLEDGYFERNQSHSYDNAVKYNQKGLELYNNKLLHKSPSGSGRNESPSNRPSLHYGYKSYTQRMRDKDRRDSLSSKSPSNKERSKSNSANPNFSSSGRENSFSSSSSKNVENSRTNNSYRTSSNHEQNKADQADATQRSKLKNSSGVSKEKRLQVGDWSEHTSSSGKRYYYNCHTEVSQWEKPKEWLDWERHHGMPKGSEQNKAKFHNYDHHHSSSSSLKERHSSNSSDNNRTPHARRPSASNKPDSEDRQEKASRPQANGTNDGHEEDMDISPGTAVEMAAASSRSAAPLQSPSQQQVSLSDLPKVISQLAGAGSAMPNLSPQDALKTIQQALQLTKKVTTLAQSDSNKAASLKGALKCHCPPPNTSTSSSSSAAAELPKQPQAAVKVESSPQRKEASPEAKCQQATTASSRLAPEASSSSPTSDTLSSRPTSPSPAAGGSLGSLGSTLPTPTGLSPQLVQYYREELVAHVAGWPADAAERQAARLADEAMVVTHTVTPRLTCELKMARSQVRVDEIQATLQEQRIIFLRQQIRFTEDLRTQKFNEPTS